MIIVELTGCPGVGKSVLTDRIYKELDNRGCSRYRMRANWKHLRRVQMLLDRLAIATDSECAKARKAGEAVIKHLEDDSRRRWFEITLWHIKLIRKAEKSNVDFLVLDEGCIQNISSIDYDTELSAGVLEFADYVFSNVYATRDIRIVSCELDFEENLRRLMVRNRENDRFLVGSRDAIAARLNQKKQNCDILSAMTQKEILRVDTGDADTAVSQIMQFVLRREKALTNKLSGALR